MTTKRNTIAGLLALTLIATAGVAHAGRTRTPRVQIAILLDTSGSMSGLIDQARTQLWRVVNEFDTATQQGRRPVVEVALYEYGKASLSKRSGFMRQVSPFTTDLDSVSESLFGLTTNGGDEHCGQVIAKATRDLQWSTSADDLRVMFVAGNERFTQGPVDYKKAIRDAKQKDIVVNTVHCGSKRDGRSGKWEHAAALADGNYLVIDHNRAVASVSAPQDAEIRRLGAELNRTYVGYGSGGKKAKARQKAQDDNAAREPASGAMVQRALTKAGRSYDNSHWDLVDAVDKGKVDLDAVASDDLPAELRGAGKADRKEFVAKKKAERARIQKRIKSLNEERRKFVEAREAESGAAEEGTLGAAVRRTVRTQAEGKAFSF